MIKRDRIQRVTLTRSKDNQGGRPTDKNYHEFVEACVSVSTNYAIMTQFNLSHERVLQVVTNNKLADGQNDRYQFDKTLYQVRRQVKQGTEYYSVLVETPN